MMPRTRAVLVASLVLPACPPPSASHFTATAPEPLPTDTDSTGATSTGDEPLLTTTLPATTNDEPGTTGTTAAPDDTTAAEPPADPPAIDEAIFDPDPLTSPAPIVVTVHTEHADGVSLQVDADAPRELLPAGPDVFTTALHYYSSQANGLHDAVFTPWSKGQPGKQRVTDFEVALPPGGGEVFWEAIPALGPGHVAAVAVLPDGAIVEFGTLVDGDSRCYLRRRTPAGAWTQPDDVQLLPDTPCKAIDLGVTADGALYLLADRDDMKDLSWWLARIKNFGAQPENLRFGAKDEKAYALAMHPERAAVCGTQPTPKLDVMAMAWIYAFEGSGGTQSFNFVENGKSKTFDEIPHDCAFRSQVLIMAGVLNGQHDPDDLNAPKLDRLFFLEFAPGAPLPIWTIDGEPKELTQSAAQALAIDDKGRIVVGGYVCGFPCTSKTSELRVYEPEGTLTWQMPLAPSVATPVDLAWSPAGYLVFTSALELGGWSSSFFVQAWKPGQYPALWSYTKNVAPTFHAANAVAIGPSGQIYTGGVGSNGYPAIAFLNP